MAAMLIVPACADTTPLSAERDQTPPTLTVSSPGAASFDADSNGLVDIRIDWGDSGAVDVTTASILVAGPGFSVDARSAWSVTRLDQTGITLSEPIAQLLPSARYQVTVSVRDTSGNVADTTISFTVPRATLVRTIRSGRTLRLFPIEGLAICEDGKLYAGVDKEAMLVDIDALTLDTLVPAATLFGTTSIRLVWPLCLPGIPTLFFAGGPVARLDRTTRSWLTTVSGSFETASLALSRVEPDRIYAGETNDGVIGILSRQANSRVGRLLEFTNYSHIVAVCPLLGDTRIYAALQPFGGVLVIDPARDTILQTIRVSTPGYRDDGGVSGMVLSADDRTLYTTVLYGNWTGVRAIDTGTNMVVRSYNMTGQALAIHLALSPDQKLLFVTTQDANGPSNNYLLDAATFQVIQLLPRPRPPGAIRFDRGVVFHPNGKYVFVAHNLDVDAYLIRPSP